MLTIYIIPKYMNIFYQPEEDHFIWVKYSYNRGKKKLIYIV